MSNLLIRILFLHGEGGRKEGFVDNNNEVNMMKLLLKLRLEVLTKHPIEGTFVALILLAFCPTISSATAQNLLTLTNFCAKTSKDILESCQDGTESDFSLAIAKCNIFVTLRCGTNAKRRRRFDMKDALQTCKDQFNVRQAACKRL